MKYEVMAADEMHQNGPHLWINTDINTILGLLSIAYLFPCKLLARSITLFVLFSDFDESVSQWLQHITRSYSSFSGMMVHSFPHAHLYTGRFFLQVIASLFMPRVEPVSVQNNAINYSLTVTLGPRMPFSIRCGLTLLCLSMLPLLLVQGVLMTTNDFLSPWCVTLMIRRIYWMY